MDFTDPRIAKLKGKVIARIPSHATPSSSIVRVRTVITTHRIARPPTTSSSPDSDSYTAKATSRKRKLTSRKADRDTKPLKKSGPTLQDSDSDSSSPPTNNSFTSAASRADRLVERPLVPLTNSTSNDFLDANSLVQQNSNAFIPYFKSCGNKSEQKSWPENGNYPVVELEYPGGGKEKFALVVPKVDDDEFRPLNDLLNVIRVTLGHYLTEEQCLYHFSERHPIANISLSGQFSFLTTSRNNMSSPRDSRSPSLVASDSRSATPLVNSTTDQESIRNVPLLQALEKAKRKRDGPRFIQLVDYFNKVIRTLRSNGSISTTISRMRGVKLPIWELIGKQTYERRVGPRVELLKQYTSWSDNVYGELKPSFISDVVHLTNLRPGQVFVDLGSGVGNCVVQVAIESGATCVGFENMTNASQLAFEQREEIVARSSTLWGLSIGDIHCYEADFTQDSRVDTWLQKANVVLVNNQVFTPQLNEALTLRFLDLRDGTKVVSLKPFVPPDFRLTVRTRDSPLAILDQGKAREYARGSVSWTGEGGTFYIATVDRSKLAKLPAN